MMSQDFHNASNVSISSDVEDDVDLLDREDDFTSA